MAARQITFRAPTVASIEAESTAGSQSILKPPRPAPVPSLPHLHAQKAIPCGGPHLNTLFPSQDPMVGELGARRKWWLRKTAEVRRPEKGRGHIPPRDEEAEKRSKTLA